MGPGHTFTSGFAVSKTYTHYVDNCSSRFGVKPRLVVIHTTEGHNRPGVGDLESLAAWFDNPVSQASAHLGIDQEGNCVRMVRDAEKAWAVGVANPWTLNIELVGFARWSKWFWKTQYRKGLGRAAKAVAAWSIKYNIPLTKDPHRGVCGHDEVPGNDHWDPGPGFPWKTFLLWCRLERLRQKGIRPDLQRRWRSVVMSWLRR
jgi:N-acetyl-anhydromuramyl-L-alanine amidase AmpD